MTSRIRQAADQSRVRFPLAKRTQCTIPAFVAIRRILLRSLCGIPGKVQDSGNFAGTAECFPLDVYMHLFNPFLCLRSEEHTSELQSLAYLVCRLLLEKKKYILLTRVASLMIYTLTAISIFVFLCMLQLLAFFISIQFTFFVHFLLLS